MTDLGEDLYRITFRDLYGVQDGVGLWFRCPTCERKVTVRTARRLSALESLANYRFKTCPGCRTVWTVAGVQAASDPPKVRLLGTTEEAA